VSGLKPGQRGLLLAAVAALLWSSGGLFIKSLSLGPLQIAGWRSLVTGLTVLAAMRVRGERWRLERDRLSLGCTLAYAGVLILFVAATKWTTSANAIFLQYSAPVFLVFLEPWSFKRPIHARDLAAVAICVGGLALFFVGRLGRGGMAGNLMGVASGFCLALFTLGLKWNRVRRPEQSPYGQVASGNLAVFLICLPAILAGPRLTGAQALALLYLGVIQLGLGWMLFTDGMRYLSATAAMITGMLEAVFNPVWVYLGVGERPSAFGLLGGVVVLGTVAWYNLKSSAKSPLDD
jgi:drug/metabolite transporter (DMT)-like permease